MTNRDEKINSKPTKQNHTLEDKPNHEIMSETYEKKPEIDEEEPITENRDKVPVEEGEEEPVQEKDKEVIAERTDKKHTELY